MKSKDKKMVKSRSNKMHLEVNNELELDFNNASMSKWSRKSKKSSSSPIRSKRKVSNNLKSSRLMASAKPKKVAIKKAKKQSKRMTANRGSSFKSKQLMPSILINGKRVPAKTLKMSSGPKFKNVAMSSTARKNVSRSRRGASSSRRKASTSRRVASSSRRNVSESRRKASASRRKVSDSRRKASDARRKDSESRRNISDSRKRASESRRKASDSRRRASGARRKASGRHSYSLPLVMSSVPKKEAFASPSRRKAPKLSSRNPGFSLKIKAKKMSSSVNKKSKSVQKMVRFAKIDKNGNGKSQTVYMPIKQNSHGKSAEAIVVKKEGNANANKVDVMKVKIEKLFNPP